MTEDAKALRSDPIFRSDVLADMLRALVRCRSVNPGVYEGAMAEQVGHLLADVCEVTFVDSLPARPSVAAVLRGRREGPRLVLNGHMDTVPVDDPGQWTVEPFSAELRDGCVYGRGACDMKAGLVAQIAVARHLATVRDRIRGSLVLHFAIGEECGEPGTESLLRAGFSGDVGVVTEPTELRIATATRGRAYYRVKIRGRSIHASRPHEGINPISRLGAVLDVVREYEHSVASRTHALLPAGTCTPTGVSGGVVYNAVPDSCDVVLDRRLLPGEDADNEMKVLEAKLGSIREGDPGFRFEIERLADHFEAAETDAECDFVHKMRNAVEAVTGGVTPVVGAPFSCDFSHLVNDAGMEAVVFGPGSVSECHCADERVAIDQVRDAALILGVMARAVLLDD